MKRMFGRCGAFGLLPVAVFIMSALLLASCPGGDGSADSVDKNALSAKIGEAENKLEDVVPSEDGTDILPSIKWATQDAIARLTDAIDAATAVYNNSGASQKSVDAAWADISLAVAQFNPKKGTKPASKTELNAAITEARREWSEVNPAPNGNSTLPNAWWSTVAQRNAFETAINAADAVSKRDDASESEIAEAFIALTAARELFSTQKRPGTTPNRAELVNLISQAEDSLRTTLANENDGKDLLPGQWWAPAILWRNLETGVNTAKNFLIQENVTQNDVTGAINALRGRYNEFLAERKDGAVLPSGAVVTWSSPGITNINLGVTQILSWRDNDIFPITISGDFENFAWFGDGVLIVSGPKEKTFNLRARDFSPGRHRLSVQVTDDDGDVYSNSLNFIVY